jgi:hypothetical protein
MIEWWGRRPFGWAVIWLTTSDWVWDGTENPYRFYPNNSQKRTPPMSTGLQATFQNIQNMHASSQVASLAYRFSQSGLCIASRRTWPVVACPVMNTDSV